MMNFNDVLSIILKSNPNNVKQNEDNKVSWNFHKFLIDEDGSFYKSLPSASDPFCHEILEWLK